MTVIDVGVRELQRETSRLVRDVEESGTTYRVTIQGRPTSVVLAPASRRGATLEEVKAFWRSNPKPPEVVAAQLAELERGRDAGGFVGDHSPYDDLSSLTDAIIARMKQCEVDVYYLPHIPAGDPNPVSRGALAKANQAIASRLAQGWSVLTTNWTGSQLLVTYFR